MSLLATPPVPLPDPPPQAKVAIIHWSSFYRHPFRLYVTASAVSAGPLMFGNGRTALADSLDIVTAELELLIDRHFAANRELIVSNDEGKFWTAAIGDTVLYRSPDGRATLRFARTFVERNPAV